VTLSTLTSKYLQKIYGRKSFSNKQASKIQRIAEVSKKVLSVEDEVNVIKQTEIGKKKSVA
jgi:hypothetical protein